MVIFTLAANKLVPAEPGKRLLSYTKPAKSLQVLLPAKQKVDLSWMYLVWKLSYQVARSTLSQLRITINLLEKQWNSKWLRSMKLSRMPLYLIKHLSKAISKHSVLKLSVSWKKDKYWKVPSRTLPISVRSLILVA